MKKLIIFCIAAALVLPGCAWFRSKPEKSATELAREGMEEFEDGDFKQAIEAFEKLKDWYPFSKYAILAELKIADAYYQLEEYEEAVFAYEEFENLHPRNEAVPYVVYQIGRCYFDQIDTVDRDQTPARKALDTFNRLVNQHPDSRYVNKARAHIKKCQQSLAGHEFYVGMFYYKAKRYKTALNRFMTVVTDYPDVGVHQKALEYIARCRSSLADEKGDDAKKE